MESTQAQSQTQLDETTTVLSETTTTETITETKRKVSDLPELQEEMTISEIFTRFEAEVGSRGLGRGVKRLFHSIKPYINEERSDLIDDVVSGGTWKPFATIEFTIHQARIVLREAFEEQRNICCFTYCSDKGITTKLAKIVSIFEDDKGNTKIKYVDLRNPKTTLTFDMKNLISVSYVVVNPLTIKELS